MNGKILLISGTPGTGKTTLAKIVCKKQDFKYINLTTLVVKERLYEKTDEIRKTKIVDENKVKAFLKNIVEKSDRKIVLDSHIADIVPSNILMKAIILRSDPDVLVERLKQRGWVWEKILENVQAEILDVCLIEALTAYPKELIYEIDTSSLNMENSVKAIIDIISGKGEKYRYGKINWLTKLASQNKLEKYFH